MNQIYASFFCHLFLFNIQQSFGYKWQDFTDKADLYLFVADFVLLVPKLCSLQIQKSILSLFGPEFTQFIPQFHSEI